MKHAQFTFAREDFSAYITELNRQLDAFEDMHADNDLKAKRLALKHLRSAASSASLAVEAYHRHLDAVEASWARRTVAASDDAPDGTVQVVRLKQSEERTPTAYEASMIGRSPVR